MRKETKIAFLIIILTASTLIYHGIFTINKDNLLTDTNNKENSENPTLPKSSAPPFVWSYPSSYEVMSCDISSNGNYIVSADGALLRFFIKSSSSPQWSFQGSGIEKVSISSDGFYIASKGSMSMFLHQRMSSDPLWNYTDETDLLRDVKISEDGNYIIVGADRPEARLFDNTGVSIQNYSLGSDVVSVAISSNGFYIVVGTKWDGVYLFNRTSNEFMWRYPVSNWVRCVDISSDGKYIVAGSDNHYLYLLNNSIENPKTPIWSFKEVYYVFSVDINPNGEYFVSSSSNYVYLHHKSSSKPIWSYTNGKNLVWFNEVKVSNDGNYILTGDDDLSYPSSNNEKVYLFHRAQNISLWEYTTPRSVLSVAISSDGEYCVAGTELLSGKTYLFRKYNPPLAPSLTSNAETPIDRDGMFDLLWDPSSTTNSYTVYTYDKLITKINSSLTKYEGITDPYYNITGLSTGRYYYLVVAFNSTGYALSNCIEIIIKIFPKSFLLDSNAETPIDRDGTFNLTWDLSVGADNYSVYSHNAFIYEIKNNGTLEDQGIEDLNYTISGLTSGDYYYIVIAYNENGNTSSNCLQVSVRIPPKPFNMFTDANDPDTDGTFNLTWTQSIGAINYSVYRSNNPILNLDNCLEIKNNITDLNYTIAGMMTGIYYFVIVAYNATGFTLSNYIQINVSRPVSILPPTKDGDDDDDGEELAISFGLYFVPFIAISILIMIKYKKRKLSKSKIKSL